MTATTSVAAHRGYAKLPIYCASKGAVVSLVRAVAADVAPEIRVNAVSAGSMETEIAAHTAEDQGTSVDAQPQFERNLETGRGSRPHQRPITSV